MAYSSETPVTLLGAGPVSYGDIEEILEIAPNLVAADGGAAAALTVGKAPDLVIGDFDSLPQFVSDTLPKERLLYVPEQDTTDFEKCLARISAPLILALGFTGRRADHELAVYNALVRVPAAPCIVLGAHDLTFLAPVRLRLDLTHGQRISLFPMGAVRGRSTGLRWPIDGLDFAPDGRVGTSNIAEGQVTLEFDTGKMLVIMPRAGLEAAMAALAGD